MSEWNTVNFNTSAHVHTSLSAKYRHIAYFLHSFVTKETCIAWIQRTRENSTQYAGLCGSGNSLRDILPLWREQNNTLLNTKKDQLMRLSLSKLKSEDSQPHQCWHYSIIWLELTSRCSVNWTESKTLSLSIDWWFNSVALMYLFITTYFVFKINNKFTHHYRETICHESWGILQVHRWMVYPGHQQLSTIRYQFV